MASRTLLSNNGNHRLVISTICTHLAVYHEAGFEFTTERKQEVQFNLWNPATWGGGSQFKKSNNALQPTITEVTFIVGADVERNPADFGVKSTMSTGYFKSSCVYSFIGSPTPNELGNDARSVNKVRVRFSYNGQNHTLTHA